MTAARTCLAAALLVTACSGPDTPADPTWADVQPILASNCVRCHGFPATNGAPDGFRLDVYNDTTLADTRVIRGASAVAEFVSFRTSHELSVDAEGNLKYPLMPPTVAINDRQRAILFDWREANIAPNDPDLGAIFGIRPPLGERTDDSEPTLRLLRPLNDSVEGPFLRILYEIRDPEHDMVRGQLLANGINIGELHSGRDELTWDIGAEQTGNYELTAQLDDGSGLVELAVGRFDVVHGNTAPKVEIIQPGPHALLHSTLDVSDRVQIRVIDPDGDLPTLTVEARRGTDSEVLILDAAAGNDYLFRWPDLPSVPEGGGWRIHATASDASSMRTAVSMTPFRISHSTTGETFGTDPDPESFCESDSVCDVFQRYCSDCHPGEYILDPDPLPSRYRIPDVLQCFLRWGDLADTNEQYCLDESFVGVHTMRGPIYRRVIELGDMPPRSQVTRPTQDELARLSDWLLGGSPE